MLRTMRFLRIFRLFNAKLSADKFVSLELARHMKKITTMSCFITAQLEAQKDLVKYFGGNGKIDEAEEAEIARCILQSQVSTYKALLAAAATQKQIGSTICNELGCLYQRKEIIDSLSHFVEDAFHNGAINSTEATAILEPMHEQVASCMKQLQERSEGVLSRSSYLASQSAILENGFNAGSVRLGLSNDDGCLEGGGADLGLVGKGISNRTVQ